MTTQTESHTRLHGRWLLIARLAWVVMLTVLTVMYALGFLAVHDVLSTVCEEELCTLRQQIRHTGAVEQVKALDALGLTLNQYGWLAASQIGLPALEQYTS